MYKSVRIQNFRGFEDLTVDGLTRVNLIVGENNVGKTALLEAMVLLSSRARAMQAYRLQNLRGLAVDRRSIPALFGWLFPRQDASLPVTIFGNDDGGRMERATIAIEGPPGRRRTTLTDTEEGTAATASRYEWLVHTYWADWDAEPLTGRINVAPPPTGTVVTQPIIEAEEPIVDTDWVHLPVEEPVDARKDAERFSQLVKLRRKSEFVDTLKRVVEPRLLDVVLLETGGRSELYVDIEGIGLAPMGTLGTGTSRLNSILLAMPEAKGGRLFIDEVDTGLHYSVLKDVWTAIGDAAAQSSFDCQLFATTHSYECMVAAYEAFADHPEDFSMHRLERGPDGVIKSHDFGHESLGTALELGFEVR